MKDLIGSFLLMLIPLTPLFIIIYVNFFIKSKQIKKIEKILKIIQLEKFYVLNHAKISGIKIRFFRDLDYIWIIYFKNQNIKSEKFFKSLNKCKKNFLKKLKRF